MITRREKDEFRDAMVPVSLLQEAIEWISTNMEVEDVFPLAVLVPWAKDWAEENGYVKEEDK
jgi:hypothetical protein